MKDLQILFWTKETLWVKTVEDHWPNVGWIHFIVPFCMNMGKSAFIGLFMCLFVWLFYTFVQFVMLLYWCLTLDNTINLYHIHYRCSSDTQNTPKPLCHREGWWHEGGRIWTSRWVLFSQAGLKTVMAWIPVSTIQWVLKLERIKTKNYEANKRQIFQLLHYFYITNEVKLVSLVMWLFVDMISCSCFHWSTSCSLDRLESWCKFLFKLLCWWYNLQ